MTGSGNVPRVNLTYKITPDKMVYATFSKGFRPGGVNRTAQKGIGPYQTDYLKNYEIGWKTQWFDHRLRWNGAVFWEDWNNFQFAFLGPNSVTIIENGGNATIKGIENEFEWQATSALTLSTNFTFLDPRLTQDYCGVSGVTSCPNYVTPEAFIPNLKGPQAPDGTNLPITPKFKGNAIARYNFDEIKGWKPFGQAAFVYQTKSTPTLRVDQTQIIGAQPAYGLLDVFGGATYDNMTAQLIVTNVTNKLASCRALCRRCRRPRLNRTSSPRSRAPSRSSSDRSSDMAPSCQLARGAFSRGAALDEMCLSRWGVTRDGERGASDIAIDNCVPPEDALVGVEGIPEKFAAGSTVAAVSIAMALVAETGARLVEAGADPLNCSFRRMWASNPDHNQQGSRPTNASSRGGDAAVRAGGRSGRHQDRGRAHRRYRPHHAPSARPHAPGRRRGSDRSDGGPAPQVAAPGRLRGGRGRAWPGASERRGVGAQHRGMDAHARGRHALGTHATARGGG